MARRMLPIFLFILFFFPLSGRVSAQITDETGPDQATQSLSQSSFTITLSPKNPKPHDSITVTVSSYELNLDSADISWKEDGKVKLSGVGKKTYFLSAKDAGIQTAIDITVTPVHGEPIQKTVIITPAGVDLLWQAVDSVVPPLYRGKALPSSESKIKFVAIPLVKNSDGTLAKQSDLLYDWQENFTPRPDDSGYGKNSVTITTNYLHPSETIAVAAASRDELNMTNAEVSLTTGSPKILWYASSPLYGPLYDHALSDSYDVADSSTSIIAEPYFFSPANPLSPRLEYRWTLNGETITTPSIPNTVFLQRGDSRAGTADLALTITNTSLLFQSVAASLMLNLK